MISIIVNMNERDKRPPNETLRLERYKAAHEHSNRAFCLYILSLLLEQRDTGGEERQRSGYNIRRSDACRKPRDLTSVTSLWVGKAGADDLKKKDIQIY